MSEVISVEELPEELQESLSAIGAHENIEHIIKEEPGNDFIVTVDPCEDANDYFVIEEYEEPTGAIQHPSVAANKEEFLARLKNSTQCYLCPDQTFKWQPRVERHFLRAHIEQGIRLAGMLVVQCRLGCKKDSHFHCPHAECLFSCKHQHRLRLHYSLNHEPCSGSEAITQLLEYHDRAQQDQKGDIKFELKEDFEDAMVGSPEIDDRVLSEIYGEEDEMAEVRPATMSETLEVTHEMYKGKMDEEGREQFLDLLKQPSEKLSIAHNKKELLQRLEPPHCYLCPDRNFTSRSRLVRHFTQLHLSHSIKVANFFVSLCKLYCSRFSLAHYHCPFPNCLATVKVKTRLVTHFKKHLDYLLLSHKAAPNMSFLNAGKRYWKRSMLVEDRTDLPPPKKAFPFHGVDWSPHASISTSAISLLDQLCLPFCFLCHDHKAFNAMNRLERHFRMAHLNRAVDCGSCYVIQCGLDCLEGTDVLHKHYHCPYCPLRDARRCAFWIHLESHRREGHVAEQMKKVRLGFDRPVVHESALLPDDPVVTISLTGTQESNQSSLIIEEHQNWNETFHNIPVRKVPAISTSREAVLAAAKLPHCYLCNDDKDYICDRRLLAHITRCHLKPFFKMDQLLVLLCKRYCGDKHEDRGHYHCLFCPFVCRQKQRVHVHVMKHVRMVAKQSTTAEYHLPKQMEDHSVPEEWIPVESRGDIRKWEEQFNDFLVNVFAKNAKTNNNILTEKKKYLIYNNTRFNMDIVDRSLKYWVRFRGVKVISCSQLSLHNVLVLPLTKYNNDEENRAVNVQPEPQFDGFNLILQSDDMEHEFFKSYRLIPTREEMFKLLYQMHVLQGSHPAPKTMFGEIRRKYLYFPRSVVDKFVSLCPNCRAQYPDKSCSQTPPVTLHNADTVALAALQVTVVDMTEHPDGLYRYVVECFDRCSRLSWLIPAERAVAVDLAEAVIRSVLAVTGLPAVLVTNCGQEFLEKMLQEITKRWHGPCTELLHNSRLAATGLSVLGSDDLMDALQELVTLQPGAWASALPHLQFRLNHTRGQHTQDQSAYELVFGRQRSRPTWQRFLGGERRGSGGDEEEEDGED